MRIAQNNSRTSELYGNPKFGLEALEIYIPGIFFLSRECFQFSPGELRLFSKILDINTWRLISDLVYEIILSRV
jgi:hypothetical protein